MRKFPGEERRTTEIQENLREQFEYCEHIYKFWIETDFDRWMEKAQVNERVCLLVGILHVQAFRLYRSIVEECKRGEAFAARILCRSLFETVAALLFVLKPTVCIRLEPKMKKGARTTDSAGRPGATAVAIKRSESVAKDRLSNEFRARLYIAHAFIELEEHETKCATTDGLKGIHRRAKARVDKTEIAMIEAEIGLEWSYVLRNYPFSYSGLTVKRLCKMLHKQMLKWYETIYNFQSRDVHAANALDHFRFTNGRDGELNAISTDDEVLRVLQGAAIQFRAIIAIMEEYIGFGPGNPSSIAFFDKEYDRLFKRK